MFDECKECKFRLRLKLYDKDHFLYGKCLYEVFLFLCSLYPKLKSPRDCTLEWFIEFSPSCFVNCFDYSVLACGCFFVKKSHEENKK